MNAQQFARAMQCTPALAAVWFEPFAAAMAELGIDATAERTAAFLAQVGHESASLCTLQENLNYSAQRMCQVWPRRFPTLESAHFYEHSPERLANLVYASRNGNGAFESGDGWRYHGRGPIQITFADNYRRCGIALNLPLLEKPDLLLDPVNGARSAAWFWEDHGCNEKADAGDFEAITRAINGGLNGLDDRRARFDVAYPVLA